MTEALAVNEWPAGSAHEEILRVEGLHTFIQTEGGVVRAVDDVSFSLRRRRDPRGGRRERLGQERHLPHARWG